MSFHMLFECVGGFIGSVLPHDPDGFTREPDGVRYLDISEVARRTGADPAAIEEVYGIFLAEAMTAGAPATPLRASLRAKYAHLSDDHFEFLLAECRRRGLSPYGKHLWADVRWNNRTGSNDLVITLGVDGFHCVAIRTGELLKISAPEWRDPAGVWHDAWDSDSPPVAARVYVHRKGGEDAACVPAHWREYAPYKAGSGGKRIYDDFWIKMPAHMLAKCAVCLSIRRAFADVLDGIYSPEEMAQSRNPRPGPTAPSADEEFQEERVVIPLDDEALNSPRQFDLALLDLGLKTPELRKKVVDEFRGRYRTLHAANISGFRRAVLEAVQRNPNAYGAQMSA